MVDPPFVSALCEAGYEAISFVHTGDGYTPEAVTRDVATFVEAVGADPVRLLGWSQGTAIAQEVALSRPDLVVSAVLIATYGRQNVIDGLLQEAWAALIDGGHELASVRNALLLLTSYPPDMLGDDTTVEPLICHQPCSALLQRELIVTMAA